MSALFRKAVADVTRRRGRTILVVLGILVGVFGLTTINVANDFLSAGFAYTHNQISAPDIAISVQGLNPALEDRLAQIKNIKTVQVSTSYDSRWHIQTALGHTNITIIGYQNFQQVRINRFQLLSGRLPGRDEILMEASNRVLQSFVIGDRITIETPHGPASVRVVGQVRTLGLTGPILTGQAQAYMSADGLAALTGQKQANMVQVQVNDQRQVNQTARELAAFLGQQHIVVLGTQIIDHSSDISANIVSSLLTIMRVLSLIALILTSFLILNTVTTLVTEQMRIIGSLKAIGGTRAAIMRGYLLSILIYGLLGTLLGLGLGILGGYQLTNYIASLLVLDLGPQQISAPILLLSLLVGLGVPLLAALFPLWQGTRITVREAMAGYGTSGAGRAGRLTRSLTWVPQTTWLSLRSLSRRRGRTALTLLALIFSATAFLAIQSTTYSFDRGLDQLVGTYNFDLAVGTNPQPYASLQTQIQAQPNVARVERWQSQTIKVPQGPLLLTGVETNTQLFAHPLLAGRWFRGEEPGALVVADVLADRLHLKVGDTLVLNNPTGPTTWRVIGEMRNLNGASGGYLGSAITTIENFDRFTSFPTDLASSVMIGAHDRSPAAVERLANALDTTLSQAGMTPSETTIQQVIKQNQSQFQIIDTLLYAVGAIVALVGILGLFNTLTTSILERRREIGILRSIGATRAKIAAISWREALVLAVVAWFIAVVLGIPSAYAFVSLIGALLLPIPFSFSPLALVLMLAFSLVIATLASAGPALSAARMRIAETLRYE